MSKSTHHFHFIAAALVAISGLVACSSADDTAALTTTANPPTTGTVSTTTTDTTTTDTTTTDTTTTTEANTCPAGTRIPPDATDVTETSTDLDLDGLDDNVKTYFPLTGEYWRIRVEWATGGSTDQVINDSANGNRVRPIGPYDVDGDGTPELFVVVGNGAAIDLVGIYDIAGCELTRVTLNGTEASFPIGASAQHVRGLSCGPVSNLDRLFADFVADDTFEGGVETFTLSGSELTAGSSDETTFTSGEMDAWVFLGCGDLQWPLR
jgi:hypothetical protein